MLGKEVYSQGWGLRGVVGAGSPGSPSGSRPIPAAAAEIESVQLPNSWDLQRGSSSRILVLPAPGKGRG